MVWESKFFQKKIDYNWTFYPNLGENIALSVVATEDSSFCNHIGIDINEIYKDEFCISPLKSLSVHLTNINSSYGLSPFVDYKKLWDENKFNG